MQFQAIIDQLQDQSSFSPRQKELAHKAILSLRHMQRLETPSGKILEKLGACDDGVKWIKGMALEKGWYKVNNPLWLMWFATRVGVHKKNVVSTLCKMARAIEQLEPGNYRREFYVPDERFIKVIKDAEKWVEGGPVIKELCAETLLTVLSSNLHDIMVDEIPDWCKEDYHSDVNLYHAAKAHELVYILLKQPFISDKQEKALSVQFTEIIKNEIPWDTVNKALTALNL